MYRDIYPDDWYWLRMRFEGWALLSADANTAEAMVNAAWNGASYGEIAEWIMGQLGLYCAISRNGNLLVWHPAVYRPSQRHYSLNLDTETTDGGRLETVQGRIDGSRITGTDMRATPVDHDESLQHPDAPRGALGKLLTIDSNNSDGTCPVEVFDAAIYRNALLRQYAQRGGDCVLAVGTVGKRGLLYDIGDILTITTERAATANYLITDLNPSGDGLSVEFSAINFPSWPAATTVLAPATAPYAIYRGAGKEYGEDLDIRTLINRTWRTDASKLPNLTGPADGIMRYDERLGTWEGNGWAPNDNAHDARVAITLPAAVDVSTYIDCELAFLTPASGWDYRTMMLIDGHAGMATLELRLNYSETGMYFLELVTPPVDFDRAVGGVHDESAYGERTLRCTIEIIRRAGTPTTLEARLLGGALGWAEFDDTGDLTPLTIHFMGHVTAGVSIDAVWSYIRIGNTTWADTATNVRPLNGEDQMY
jgi:hypothetical protein